MNERRKSTLMLVVSMAIFGTIGAFVKNIALSSAEKALYRAIMATVVIGLFLLIKKQKIEIKKIKRELALLLLSGVAMAFNWILLFEAYKYTTVSTATLAYYFAPVIVTVACPFLFKEKIGAKQWICFAMSTVGIILITVTTESAPPTHFLGILFGLGAAILYATVILLNKSLKSVEGISRTFIQFIAAVIVLIPYVLLTSGINITSLNATGAVNLVIVGVIHTGITYCLYFSSLKELPGQHAAILSYIDPLVAVIVSVTVLNETMTLMQIIGGALILGFTVWNELDAKTLIAIKEKILKNKKSK